MYSEQFRSRVHPDIAHIHFNSLGEGERMRRLSGIKRFATIKEMTHRTSVLEHELRVSRHSTLFAKMLIAFGERMDLKRVLFFADHHDDPELETGDIATSKKRTASKEELSKMEDDERFAAQRIDHLVQKPLGFRSFPEEFARLKAQKSLEAKVVNYADKWDGLHEAIHEVVCGNNQEGFKKVINDYKPDSEELNEKNKDWHDKLKRVLGDNFFDFPVPDKLIPKSPKDLNYNKAIDFIKSIADGNPRSYFFWLRFNESLFGIEFLTYTFPGWIKKFPKEVLADIERVKTKAPLKKRQSGLFIPSTEIDIFNPTFGESLTMDTLGVQLEMAARIASGHFNSSI